MVSSDPDPPEVSFNFQLLLTIAQKFDLFFVAKVIPGFFVLSNIYLSFWPHFSFLFTAYGYLYNI